MFTKLFVGNLSFQATEEDVRELFQHAGTLGSVRIVTDQFTSPSLPSRTTRQRENQGVAGAPSRAASRMRRGHEGRRRVPSGERHE